MPEKALSPDSIKIMAQNIAFVSFDVIQFREHEMRSHWYRYEDIDLYYFQTTDGTVAKIHMSIFGQVVEWNAMDGVRTGLLIEQEGVAGVSEVVQYDARVNQSSLEQAQLVLSWAQKIEEHQRQVLRRCLAGEMIFHVSFWKKIARWFLSRV